MSFSTARKHQVTCHCVLHWYISNIQCTRIYKRYVKTTLIHFPYSQKISMIQVIYAWGKKKSQRLNYVCIQSFFFTIHQNVFKQRSIVYIFSNQISLTQVVLLRLHCKLHVMWRSKIWTVKYKYAINFTFLNLSKRFIFQLINCAKTAFIDIK